MTARDKHGHEVKEGDVVHTVYGGDHHVLTVEEITEAAGHHHVTGKVTIKVPAAAVQRHHTAHHATHREEEREEKDGERKEERKDERKTGAGEHRAHRTPSHDTADELEKSEAKGHTAAEQSPARKKS